MDEGSGLVAGEDKDVSFAGDKGDSQPATSTGSTLGGIRNVPTGSGASSGSSGGTVMVSSGGGRVAKTYTYSPTTTLNPVVLGEGTYKMEM